MHVGSFEPTVMFFRMTNLPVTFQAIIDEILRDLINEGKVTAFVDDILVGIEIKEGHDEIIEEIVRKLEKNDLYIKPEKCTWKDWIPGGCYRTKWDRNGRGKSR